MNRAEELAAIEVALRDPARYHRITRDDERAYNEANPGGAPTHHTRQMREALRRKMATTNERLYRARSKVVLSGESR